MPENFIHSTSPLVDSSRLILLRAQIFERVLPDAMKTKQIPCLKQEDYPLVKYWSEETFREWYETNGGGPTPTGELSKKLYFLEDGSGQLLAKKRVDHVRRRTKGIFDTIRSELKELLGDTWTHADYEFQKLLYAQLCHEFPEFVYCDDNWKIRSYLSHWYGQWNRPRNRNRDAQVDVKKEKDSDAVAVTNRSENSVANISSKRPIEGESTEPAKRPKPRPRIANPL
ncbi:hypothetical protein JOM56_003237 [Amanita muscaria]